MLSPPEDVLDDLAALVDTVAANGWISPAAFAETPGAHVEPAEAAPAANDTAAATTALTALQSDVKEAYEQPAPGVMLSSNLPNRPAAEAPEP